MRQCQPTLLLVDVVICLYGIYLQEQNLFTRRLRHRQALIKEEEMPEGSIEINFDLEIGSGGAGNVYLADYTRAGVNAAAKVKKG